MSLGRLALAGFAGIVALLFASPIIAVGMVFWMFSWLVGLLVPYVDRQWIQWPDIFQFDSTLGWKAKPNLDCYCLETRDDVFHLRTDKDGWPRTVNIEESDMIVFGDSHAFGYGVDPELAFFKLNPNLRIKPIGVPGYNVVQEYLTMERLGSQLREKIIVWFIYIGNDIYDNLSPEMSGYRAPFVREVQGNGAWEIVTSHLDPERWTCSRGSLHSRNYPIRAALHSDTFLAQRAYSACESLIERGSKLCEQIGSRLVVISIPSIFTLSSQEQERAQRDHPSLGVIDPDYPDRKLNEVCQKLGVRFIALKDFLDRQDFKPADDHWTQRGHRRVAKVLHDLYDDLQPCLR